MPEINYTSLINDANLQGYWRLESDGTDSSGNGYTVAPGTAPDYIAAKWSNGADFDVGNSEYLIIADGSCANLEISGSQTWSLWYKPETLVDGNLLSKRDAAGGAQKDIFIAATGDVAFRLTGLTDNTTATASGALSTGNWYHICGVYDSSATKLRMFVNNNKSEVTASGSATDTNGDFFIASKYNAGGTPFSFANGVIDDVAIFDRALSDAEVGVLYNADKKYYGVGIWR